VTADGPIDVAVFRELEETAGREFVGELLDAFDAEAPGMLADLRDAAAAGDAERFRRAAHSLKSNARTFGAIQLGDQARALELGGIDPDGGRTMAAIYELQTTLATARGALEDLRGA
jgi:HPt (histidine-containing phosphotransfer) domain-containing protein